MALYDGFFGAVMDEETGLYDRSYSSSDFTGYFGEIIGSGVCVYENPDSFLVRLEDGAAIISPGYLFIRGYWLRNTEEYAIEIPEAPGSYAVLAHLNLGEGLIEILVEPAVGTYPDSLALAIANTMNGTMQDTRADTELCGLIDSVGSLSAKVLYAVNYIDNEVNQKLAEAEASVTAQSALLDAKIVEVSVLVGALASPPIGTIKFSASQDIGPEWLRCDGSFVSQDDYPELVAALGKLTPGAEEFTEVLGESAASQVSNFCFADGTVWIYLLKPKKLVGFSSGGKKEITVSGVDGLVELPAVNTVLSICGGALYLAQNNQTTASFVLLECDSFTGDESGISMTALDVSRYTTGLDMTGFVPHITEIGGKLNLALGMGAKVDSFLTLDTLQWTAGSFSMATTKKYRWIREGAVGDFLSTPTNGHKKFAKSLMSFHTKNANDLLFAQGEMYYYSASTTVNSHQIHVGFRICSETQQIYGSLNTSGSIEPSYDAAYSSAELLKEDPYYKEIVGTVALPALNIIPVAANSEYLYRAEITGQNLKITYGTYNPQTVYQNKTINLRLPSRARLFEESVVYASSQGLWFMFVGTGLMFTNSLADGYWGYLDTQDVLGVITLFGCLDYDVSANTLYISGTDTMGIPRMGQLKLPKLYTYANDGAWLPSIASNGVPAYIKAKEPDEGGVAPPDTDTGTRTLTVTVLKPTAEINNQDYSASAAVTMNSVVLGIGTYERKIPLGTETFTVGLQILKNQNLNSYADLYVNGTSLVSIRMSGEAGTAKAVTLNVSDYLASGVTLQWKIT